METQKNKQETSNTKVQPAKKTTIDSSINIKFISELPKNYLKKDAGSNGTHYAQKW